MLVMVVEWCRTRGNSCQLMLDDVSKSRASDTDWTDALAAVRAEYPVERAEQQVDIIVDRIKQLPGKLAMAWSGGKDSQVLRLCCELAGVDEGVLCISGLEFPAMDRWRADHLGALEVVKSKHDAAWLQDHQEYLFPKSRFTNSKASNVVARFQKMVVHRGQEKFYRENGLDGLILGRRWADDNWTGHAKGQMSYENKGVVRHSPMADLSHTDLLGVMHHFGLPLAPCYGWKHGWSKGTGPWLYGTKLKFMPVLPDRRSELDFNFGDVWDIDPSVVVAASEVLVPAAEWLDGKLPSVET